MEKIKLTIRALFSTTKGEQVTFEESIEGNHAYMRLKLQRPNLEFIGERSVNLPKNLPIKKILEEDFNPESFEIHRVESRCTSEVCNSVEYKEGPYAWPYICAECPYNEVITTWMDSLDATHYRIVLKLISNPIREKFQSEWASSIEDAIKQAQDRNPGYKVKSISEY